MIGLDFPGRAGSFARCLADAEAETRPLAALSAGMDDDRNEIMAALQCAFNETFAPFDEIIRRAQEDCVFMDQITGRAA